MDSEDSSNIDKWDGFYRGYGLSANPKGEVWWQVYNGTERLHLDPVPEEILERVTDLKALGGRFHVTEEQEVITRVEGDDGEYQSVKVGSLDLDGRLQPAENPEKDIPVRPQDLEPGDLWPSVYDGTRFSFVSQDRVWWTNPETHQRHYIEGIPGDIAKQFRRYKSRGGSFRATPWGDVITLIPFHPLPEKVDQQFGELPEVVRSIIKLRKERGVERLPIYVGNVGEFTFNIQEASNLSDPLTPEEESNLESWAKNLGRPSDTSKADHQAGGSSDSDAGDDEELPAEFDDDPLTWTDDDILDISDR